MLEEIGSYEAKTKLPEILRRVEAGEAFTITNRGKPIADVIPSRASDRLKTEAAIATILKAKKHKISDVVLTELKESGRK
ncbi:type II toxin-antitoxin system Phd/YefM family antitoxin [Cellvibrio fontiphilus]|uniref:Antitoxin n=1 Tax=Cellvibrio fontiphilus TaxID=1815559 RepID=A0ABV7F9F9_9GAMM